MKKNVEEYESPYCDVCGHCGYIDCCGIRNFIAEHIEGKTNCKNESFVCELCGRFKTKKVECDE